MLTLSPCPGLFWGPDSSVELWARKQVILSSFQAFAYEAPQRGTHTCHLPLWLPCSLSPPQKVDRASGRPWQTQGSLQLTCLGTGVEEEAEALGDS